MSLTALLLLSTVVLLVAHEFLAARRPGSRGTWWLRPVVLVTLLVAVAAFASRAQLPARVEALVGPWRERTPAPVAFDSLGDPLFTGALAAQTPERPFPAGGSREAVAEWQRHVVERLRQLADLPPANAGTVPVDVVSTEQVGDVQRTLLTFTSWDGSRIPAYVHEPSTDRGGAAVLVVPGHGDGILATAGVVDDYQHAAALELARHGYITLTPELRGFGMLSPRGADLHRVVASAALEAGSFYKAIVVKDLGVALTVLQQWRGVNPDRLAVAGASLGGELAVLLGVLDERVRVIVSHSYSGSTGPVSVSDRAEEDRQPPHGCHTIPGVNRLVWREDWFRLLAPRPVLFVRGSQNVSPRVDEFAAAVGQAFAPFGASDRIQFLVEEGDHEFFVEPAARFLDRWLSN